jgi:hypothetical protein
LAVGQNWFKSVADLNSISVVLRGYQNQHTVVGRLAANAPLLEQSRGVTFDIRAVERLDSNDGNLRMRLLIDLLTNIIKLRDGVLVEDMSKVVDVVRWNLLLYGLGVIKKRQRND